MTRQKLPDVCNFCAKDISSEMQYCMEIIQGRSLMPQIRTKAKNLADMCQDCFMNIAKLGYEPKWFKEQRNPQYKAGSKLATEKYYIPVDNPPTAPKQEELATAI